MIRKSKSLVLQARMLVSKFPNSKILRDGADNLTWISDITPSPLSLTYKVKLVYTRKRGVSVFVIKPKSLVLAEGENRLPHIYCQKRQQLCLFHPHKNEWNNSMLLVETIVPWVSEWLLYYELWISTGQWHGGGIHPSVD